MGVHPSRVHPRGVHSGWAHPGVPADGGVPHYIIPGRTGSVVELCVGVPGYSGVAAAPPQGGVPSAAPPQGRVPDRLPRSGHKLGFREGAARRHYLNI